MKFLRVFLRSSAGEIGLDTKDHRAPFALLDGARGLGLPERSVDSTPIPSGAGSVLRSQRFDESEVVLPIAVRDSDATAVSLRTRELEKVLVPSSDEAVELVIEAPMLGTTRRRKVHYLEGLEGAVGGADSHITWRHSSVKFTALDPMWYGEVREIIQRVDPGRKPFLTERPKLKPGAQVHKESRVPTSSDAGSDGDVWYVGANAEPEKVLRRNLLLNPSASPSGSPWGYTGGGSNSSTMTAQTRNGLTTYRATLNSGQTGYIYLMPGASVSDLDTLTPVTPGEKLSASMLVASSAAGTRRLRIGFRNSAGGYQAWSPTSSPMSVPADGDLVELKLENVVVPSGSAYAYLHVIDTPSGGEDWIEGTRAQIVKSPVLGEYFDGDAPPSGNKLYRWTGPAHASTSEEYTEATDYTPHDKYVHNGTEWEHVGLEKRAPFFPIILSSSTVQGAYKIEIQGDGNAWPTWLVDGPGEDLLIENIDTGERIFITGTFDERVTINTHPTVADITSETFQDGELWDRVSTDTELFPLRPGLNRIKITMVNSRPNSMVKIGYSETWLAGW